MKLNYQVFSLLAKALLISLALVTAVKAEQVLSNQLKDHFSPYLAMHGNDPVHWQDWNADVLERAKSEGKLIFISSGYFSCHWCHVMQRESYADKAVATILNEYFIPVKLDRELEPALDAHLIDFVERTEGQAGWPLNVFLTPEGYPLIGLTYVPRDNFLLFLQRLIIVWQEDNQGTRDLARRVLLKLQEQPLVSSEARVLNAQEIADDMRRMALEVGDTFSGGFGNQSRFPMAPQLYALLKLYELKPDKELENFLQLSLKQMANLGLRDQLAGGFFRYTVDPEWHVPHYEKMLYTQAMLAEVYMLAAGILPSPGEEMDYSQVAEDTLVFMIRHMKAAEGGFIGSLSALDEQGEEGGSYLWTGDQLSSALSKEETPLALARWSLDGTATEGQLPMIGKSLSELGSDLGLETAEITGRLDSIRAKLLIERAKRPPPRDTKVLAAWNGLALAALSRMAHKTNNKNFISQARSLRDLLVENFWQEGALLRAYEDGRAFGNSSIEDYAYVAYGLDAWLELSANKADRNLFRDLLKSAWQKFHTGKGWQMSDKPLLPGMAVSSALPAGPMPSPSAIITRLSLKSEDAELKAKGLEAVEKSRNQVQEESFWNPGHGLLLITQPSL